MFGKNESIDIKVVGIFAKSYPCLKDENNSPFIIDLPTDLDSVEIPSDLLKVEIYVIKNKRIKQKELLKRIYIGEVYTTNEMMKIDNKFRFSTGMHWEDICNIKRDLPCVFYKNENYVLLGLIRPSDIVVSNTFELKELLTNLSKDFGLVQEGITRIKKI